MEFVQKYLAESCQAFAQLDVAPIAKAVDWMAEARDQDKFIFVCGNGGSASIASQIIVDLVKGASDGKPKAFRALSLTDSVATVTALGNDYCYEDVFVGQLRSYARPGDVLIAISGSGNSPNVVKAVEWANANQLRTIGLTKAGGGKLKDLAQLPLLVPSPHMGHLEDGFFIMTHILVYAFIDGAKA